MTVRKTRFKFGIIKLVYTPSPFIEVLVLSQENERSSICVLGVSILPPSAIFRLDVGNLQTMWYFCLFFILFL